MKRLISQGQAIRCTFGRVPVTRIARRHGGQRQARVAPGEKAALHDFGSGPGMAQPGRRTLAELQPL